MGIFKVVGYLMSAAVLSQVQQSLAAYSATMLGGLSCTMCSYVVKVVESKLGKESRLAIDLDGVAVCELVGLGPEDPLADVCAAAIPILCGVLAGGILKTGITPTQACQKVRLC